MSFTFHVFCCCFYKRILAVFRRYAVIGKESRNERAACFANGRWKHSFDTMLIFYGLDAVEADTERIYTCLYEILVGYPCKKTGSYPHYSQGYPLLGLNRRFFMLITGVTQFEI